MSLLNDKKRIKTSKSLRPFGGPRRKKRDGKREREGGRKSRDTRVDGYSVVEGGTSSENVYPEFR